MILPTEEPNHYRYKVESDKPARIKEVLEHYEYSRRNISEIKRLGKILRNGQPARVVSQVKNGDIIDVYLPEEHVDTFPVEGKIDIVYEDDEVLVINKPTNLVVHPTHDYQENTLANYVADYFNKTNQKVKIRFINRLDRDTTGIVLIAKNKYVHHYVQKQMGEKGTKKVYHALAHGHFDEQEGKIDLPIYRPLEDSIARVVDERGKPSTTIYRVLENFEDSSSLECEIITGRTHQIRVHLSHIGHPLIGDPLYNDLDNPYDFNRQALHAKSINLKLPKSGEHTFEASLPEDIIELEKELRGKV